MKWISLIRKHCEHLFYKKLFSIPILGVSLLFPLTFSSQAALAQASEVREFYNGARGLAMGGASIAVVNDETSLAVNPAGLGKLRDSYGTIFDPELDLSSTVGGIYAKTPITNFFEPTGVATALTASPDKYYHAKLQLFPSFVVRNFGIGILGNYNLDAKMDTLGTAMKTFYRSDVALLLGYNLRLWGGRIKLGFTGKAISRIEIDKTLDPALDMSLTTNASEGAGLGGDVGLTLAAPWVWLPTISAVVRDVGGMKFESGAGLRQTSTTRPTKVDQDIDVAVAVFPIHENRGRSVFTVEYQKMTAASKATDKTRYAHVGYEYNFADLIFLRAGMNQRYWTAGVEFATEKMQLQLTSYGEEVGADGEQEESRRVVLKFAFRF